MSATKGFLSVVFLAKVYLMEIYVKKYAQEGKKFAVWIKFLLELKKKFEN